MPMPPHRRRTALFVALLALFAVLPVYGVGAADGTFWDDDGSIHEADIEAIAAKGITKGCDVNQFCPKASVTRGQMAAFIKRALEGTIAVGTPIPFSDTAGHLFEQDIAWLSATGITKGCDTGRFCPDAAVTRGQMAAFIKRALEGTLAAGSPTPFSDTAGHLFEQDIAWLSATGVTKGCGDGKFCPDAKVTREQMASFLTRALDLDPITPEPGGNPGPGHIMIDPDELLDGHAGWGDLRIDTDYGDPRDPDLGPFPGIGTFRVFCHFSHQNFDDAIVFPGEVGRSHLHTYFGNTQTNAHTTAATITSGNSTCQGGIADRSAYWIPSMYDMQAEALVRPNFAAVYYQSGYFDSIDPATIQPIPAGLEMLAGRASATPSDNESGFQGPYWGCFNGGGGPLDTGPTIPDCPTDQQVSMIISFPQCWDGVRLDSDDHKSHMAYPSFFSGCPDSHPVAIPRIMLQILFPVADHGTDGYRLVSDMYPMDQPGGASIHADFFNGWDPTIQNRWLNACVRAVKDCERSEIGDGDALIFSFFGG